MVYPRIRAAAAHRSLAWLRVVAQTKAVALRRDIAEIVKRTIVAPRKTRRAHQKKLTRPPQNFARALSRARLTDKETAVA